MSTRLRQLTRRMAGAELIEVIRIPLDAGTFLLVRDEGHEWVLDYYVSERAEPWTLRLAAPVNGDAPETAARTTRGEGARMGVGSGDDLGQVPDGFKWCDHCNGYGSSVKDQNDRCAKCNGTGLVAADRSREAAGAPRNGASTPEVDRGEGGVADLPE
jgi:hypothetical protein